MKTGRRFFLSSFVVALAGPNALRAWAQRQAPPSQFPQVPPVPDGSASGRTQDSQDDNPPEPHLDPEERLKESQKDLRRDADRLLELAKNLKEEADKTEQTSVLSLSLIKKAEEVEKLAHQIKDLVRAS